jgi:hypothetical protein
MASRRFGCQDGFMLASRMRDKRTRSRTCTARVVQVAHKGDAAYARCRDFSDTGMKLDLTAPPELNERVTVALSRSVVLCGTVAWVSARECGIVFDGPVDSKALIEAVDGHPAAAALPATLDLLEGRSRPQHGSPARCSAASRNGMHFEPGLVVTIVTGPDREQRGVLRWAEGNVAALELEVLSADEAPLPRALLPGPNQS